MEKRELACSMKGTSSFNAHEKVLLRRGTAPRFPNSVACDEHVPLRGYGTEQNRTVLATEDVMSNAKHRRGITASKGAVLCGGASRRQFQPEK
jgi:hypothetical protein